MIEEIEINGLKQINTSLENQISNQPPPQQSNIEHLIVRNASRRSSSKKEKYK